MLSDRPYMREDYQREKTSFLVWILSAMVAGFVIQLAGEYWLRSSAFESVTGLSVGGLKRGYVWTLLTHPFAHRGALHLLAIGLPLFFVARELIGEVGERRLMWLAVGSTMVGGLVWFGVHVSTGGNLLGASAVLWCYFTVFACLYPNREISFLLFFVIPITTRPKHILWALLAFDVAGLVLTEIQRSRFSGYAIPHSAHLGAMLVGWIYFRYVHQAHWLVLRPRTELDLPRWMKRGKKAAPKLVSPPPAETVVSGKPDLRAEVDRILDKINSEGFNSLTPDEKRILAEAREMMSRR